jgi:hypothetical protein
MTVPVRHNDAAAHRRLLANAINKLEASLLAVEGTEILSTGEAGAVNYLREDGDGTSSWQPIAASGGQWVLLQTTTPIATDEDLDFTWDETAYDEIKIVLEGINTDNDGDSLRLQLGSADGATIYAANYDNIIRDWSLLAVPGTYTGTNFLQIAFPVSVTANETVSGTISITGFASADTGAMVHSKLNWISSALSAQVIRELRGWIDDTVAIDTVRLSFNGAGAAFNAVGSIRYYGLKNT